MHVVNPIKEIVQVDDVDDEEDDDKKDDNEEDEEDQKISEDLPEIQKIQDLDLEKIASKVMASLPNSLRKSLESSSLEKASTKSKTIEVKIVPPSTKLTIGFVLQSAMMSVITTTPSTKKQAPLFIVVG